MSQTKDLVGRTMIVTGANTGIGGVTAESLCRRGARVHLAMAERAPRPDWRWLHVDHAGTLAQALGDARLEALVLAYEALRDADFGEDDDALERVDKALALAQEGRGGERRAAGVGRRAGGLVAARRAASPDEPDPYSSEGP